MVCLPLLAVGYMSYTTSVQRVNKLVRHEQIVNVQEAAQKINQMFFYSRLDLQTITKMPVIEEFINAKQFKLQVQYQYNKDTIHDIFKDFIQRMDHYESIKYISNTGTNLIEAKKQTKNKKYHSIDYTSMIRKMKNMSSDQLYVSKIKQYPPTDRYVIHCASPVISTWRGFSGIVVIDIDFNTGCDLSRLSVHDQKSRGSGCRCDDHFLKQGFPGFRVPDSHIDTFDELRLLLGRLQTRGVSDKGRCDGVKQTYCLSLALKHVRNIKLGDKSQSVLNYANLSIKSS